METTSTARDTPHYAGHRDRLRERFIGGRRGRDGGLRTSSNSCSSWLSRRRTSSRSPRQLIARHESLAGVLNAPLNRSCETEKGIGRTSAIALKVVQAAARRMLKQEVIEPSRPQFSWSRLLEYCHATMAHEGIEHFRVLFLNKKNELIADENAADRHRRPHPRLPARNHETRAGPERHRPHPRSQSPERRPGAERSRHRNDRRDQGGGPAIRDSSSTTT